uniref:Uncharacterized protein n=1 Tax=Kalanchoe fedtschenkoi TaxID=63787 RepID=A0A7N0T2B9_KALFE
MGASLSSSSAAASSSPIPTDSQFRRGKLACRFLMISNCALAVYIITRPRNKEQKKAKRAPPPAPGTAAPDEYPPAAADPAPARAAADPAAAEIRIEEH